MESVENKGDGTAEKIWYTGFKTGLHLLRADHAGRNLTMRVNSNPRLFLEQLQCSPVIAAVKNEEGLVKALDSECAAVFILYGTLLDIRTLVERVKEAGKLAFVHIDLIEGLNSRDIAVDFLEETTQVDGIISTRPNLIHRAKLLGLITIQRFFLLDSLSFDSVLRQSSYADIVDILPGTMPRVIERLCAQIRQPLIASGLLQDKQDIMGALSAGALAVSTTREDLWVV